MLVGVAQSYPGGSDGGEIAMISLYTYLGSLHVNAIETQLSTSALIIRSKMIDLYLSV